MQARIVSTDDSGLKAMSQEPPQKHDQVLVSEGPLPDLPPDSDTPDLSRAWKALLPPAQAPPPQAAAEVAPACTNAQSACLRSQFIVNSCSLQALQNLQGSMQLPSVP